MKKDHEKDQGGAYVTPQVHDRCHKVRVISFGVHCQENKQGHKKVPCCGCIDTITLYKAKTTALVQRATRHEG